MNPECRSSGKPGVVARRIGAETTLVPITPGARDVALLTPGRVRR